MEPITLALIAGGAWLFLRGGEAPTPPPPIVTPVAPVTKRPPQRYVDPLDDPRVKAWIAYQEQQIAAALQAGNRPEADRLMAQLNAVIADPSVLPQILAQAQGALQAQAPAPQAPYAANPPPQAQAPAPAQGLNLQIAQAPPPLPPPKPAPVFQVAEAPAPVQGSAPQAGEVRSVPTVRVRSGMNGSNPFLKPGAMGGQGNHPVGWGPPER